MLRLGALVVIAALAATAPILSPMSSHAAPINPAATHTQQPQRGTEDAPVAVKLMNTGESDAVAAQNQAREDAKMAFEREIADKTIALTFGLVFVGIIQAFAIGYTAIVTNKAANAAQASADAVKAQIRASVGIKSVSLEHVEVGKIPRAEIILRNAGQTDALHYTQVGVMGFDRYPVPGKMPSIGEIKPRHAPPLVAGTEIHLVVALKTPLDAAQIAALQAGVAAIYVAGAIAYKDVFGERQGFDIKLFANKESGWPLEQMAAFVPDNKLTDAERGTMPKKEQT